MGRGCYVGRGVGEVGNVGDWQVEELALAGDDVEGAAGGTGQDVEQRSVIANSIEGVVELVGGAGSTGPNGNIKIRLASFTVLALESAAIPDGSAGRTAGRRS